MTYSNINNVQCHAAGGTLLILTKLMPLPWNHQMGLKFCCTNTYIHKTFYAHIHTQNLFSVSLWKQFCDKKQQHTSLMIDQGNLWTADIYNIYKKTHFSGLIKHIQWYTYCHTCFTFTAICFCNCCGKFLLYNNNKNKGTVPRWSVCVVCGGGGGGGGRISKEPLVYSDFLSCGFRVGLWNYSWNWNYCIPIIRWQTGKGCHSLFACLGLTFTETK